MVLNVKTEVIRTVSLLMEDAIVLRVVKFRHHFRQNFAYSFLDAVKWEPCVVCYLVIASHYMPKVKRVSQSRASNYTAIVLYHVLLKDTG